MININLDHFFTVLANKQRVRILQLLANDGPMNVSAISRNLPAEQSAVSHNLKKLLACHFVSMEQKGKERVYSINEDSAHPILNLIEKHVQKYCVKECVHG